MCYKSTTAFFHKLAKEIVKKKQTNKKKAKISSSHANLSLIFSMAASLAICSLLVDLMVFPLLNRCRDYASGGADKGRLARAGLHRYRCQRAEINQSRC